jgi:hypothetical protein
LCASAARRQARINRLTTADLSNLRYETQPAPMHIGALVIVEAAPLLDANGRLRLEEIRRPSAPDSRSRFAAAI